MAFTPGWARFKAAIIAELEMLIPGLPGFTTDTDVNLTANSDTRLATQKAVHTFVLANAGGAGSTPTRINASLGSTWTLSNPLGRIPIVHVFLSTGERVLTDVTATTSTITVVFPSAQQGFVLIF